MRTSRSFLTVAAALALAAGSAVVAQDEAPPDASPDPMRAEGSILTYNEFGPGISGTIRVDELGITHDEGGGFQATWEWSDPRLSGDVTYIGNRAIFEERPGSQLAVGSESFVVTNDEGRWVGQAIGMQVYDQAAYDTIVFRGEGGYEGLSAVMVIDYMKGTQNAVVFPGEMPSMPEVPAAPAEVPGATPSASPSPAPAASLATIGVPADDGAHIVAVEELDARTRDLTIESPSVGTVKVRLLLPAAFDAQPDTRWPVLYLLQGCCDTYDSWTRETDVEELTAPTDLLVVMPAATRAGDGGFGWYTDWYNGGEGGQPAWETFHLTELRELLERNWQAGDDRVIAGLSMGGHGAMTYAARHPGMFQAAASFSGVLHTLDSDADPRVWGTKTKQADIWAAHDAVSLAPALAGLPLYVSYGTGEFGPLDEDENQESADVEAWLYPQNEAFVARLAELSIPATVNVGPGTHSWPYWERGLHEAMPMLLEAVGL